MTDFRSDDPSSSPRARRDRRKVAAARLFASALHKANAFVSDVARALSVSETRVRQWQDPESGMSLPLADLLALPRPVALPIVEVLAESLDKRLVDLPSVTDDETASEFAREISQTSSGAISAILDESASKEAKLRALRTAIGVYEQATAQLLRAEREASKVRPIKGGNGNGEH